MLHMVAVGFMLPSHSLVNHRWENIAQSTPELWQNVSISMDSHYSLQKCMGITKMQAKGTKHVCIVLLNVGERCRDWQRTADSQLDTLQGISQITLAFKLEKAATYLAESGVALPNHEEMHLEIHGSSRTTKPWGTSITCALWRFSFVTSMTLNAIPSGAFKGNECFPNVRDLKLQECGLSMSLMSEFFPHITSTRLKNAYPPKGIENCTPIKFNKLRRLELNNATSVPWTYLQIPCLDRLTICQKAYDTDITTFIVNSNQLKTLNLHIGSRDGLPELLLPSGLSSIFMSFNTFQNWVGLNLKGVETVQIRHTKPAYIDISQLNNNENIYQQNLIFPCS